MSAPRLFGIQATRAPVVAVLRRGPSAWSHVGRWRLDPPSYEPGPWLRGTIYPQRCDLSPDGRWLSYFVLKPNARWEVGGTYVAVSELPQLRAVAAWSTCGTWTRGAHFVEDPREWTLDEPTTGDVAAIRRQFGMQWSHVWSYAVERRRGWTETADTPPRGEHDPWDEKRAHLVRMERARPGDPDTRLVVGGYYAAHRAMEPQPSSYTVDGVDLDAQWADWAPDGRLLVATADGRLQVRDGDRVTWEHDLSGLRPPATDDARQTRGPAPPRS